jgi:uncharacterized protein (DUF3820 family)
MTLYDNFINIGLHIGFATEYYTLWSADKPNEGRQKVWYMGRISKDKETALNKYPNAIFSGLKGMSWERDNSYKRPSIDELTNNTEFWFGKYEGQSILECDDSNYLKWVYRTSDVPNVNVISRLSSLGYILYRDHWYDTQQEVADQKQIDEVLSIIHTKDKYNCGQMVVEFTSNIHFRDHTINIHVPDYDAFNESWEYGYTVELADKFSDRIRRQENARYNWLTLDGMRSMKKIQALVKFHRGRIIDIQYKWGKED